MTSPVAIVCIGMAGSGKTTFMQRINAHLHSQKTPPYVINLDPAVRSVPYESNIDIRDSINYKEVMAQYNLGPNGGILTSLNLFTTKVDQILAILEKRCKPAVAEDSTVKDSAASATSSSQASNPAPNPIQQIIVDTPGQIEVFVWSASGSILLSALASSFPTVLAYIIDTPRTASSTATFMANMLYAVSILYRTRLPMVLVFNKTDVHDAAFAEEWMTDFETFQAALHKEEEGGEAGQGSGYMNSLLSSMSLVLEEFYRHLKVVGVSAMTGEGVDEFFVAVQEKKEEFEKEYQPELERRRAEQEKEKQSRREKEMGRLMSDLDVKGGSSRKTKAARRRPKMEPETISDLEDEDEDDGLVEPDDDDEEEVIDEGREDMDMPDEEDGLSKRFRAARKDQSGSDISFARYVHGQNLRQL